MEQKKQMSPALGSMLDGSMVFLRGDQQQRNHIVAWLHGHGDDRECAAARARRAVDVICCLLF